MKLFKKKTDNPLPDDMEKPVPKKKTLKERLGLITYMELSLSLFAFSFLVIAICIVISAVNQGQAGIYIGLIGILAFFAGIAGIMVTLYGHFIVKIEGKVKWIWGIVLNGATAVFLIVMYVIGSRV